MEYLKILGENELSGEVSISGAKNAALPLIACTILAKNEITLATSWDEANLLNGVWEADKSLIFSGILTVNSVSIKLGVTMFTLIPFGANSKANDFVKPTNADFDVI